MRFTVIFSVKPDKIITKKKKKTLAFKSQNKKIPYNIDIHTINMEIE